MGCCLLLRGSLLPQACLGLQEPVLEGTALRARKHLESRRCTFLPAPSPPPPLAVTASPPARSPAPACVSAPMPSRTPELGRVPVRQADITNRHSQTWKQPGTRRPPEAPAPLGSAEARLIPAASRQPAGTKFPRNLVNACTQVCSVSSGSKKHGTLAPSPGPRPSLSLPSQAGQAQQPPHQA